MEWFLDLSERTSYIRIGLTYKKKQVCVKGVCVAILPLMRPIRVINQRKISKVMLSFTSPLKLRACILIRE